MPAWIHGRAEHLLAKNPSMKKETAFAIATQQSHAAGKTPKGYGTAEGKSEAKEKFDKPKKEYVKTPNPGGLETPKLSDKPKTRWTGKHLVPVKTASLLEQLDEQLEKDALVWGPMLKKQLLGTGLGMLGGAAAGAAAGGEEHRLSGALAGGLGGAALGTAAGYAIPRIRTGMAAGMSGRQAVGSVVDDARVNLSHKLIGAGERLHPTGGGVRQRAAQTASAPMAVPTGAAPPPPSVIIGGQAARPSMPTAAASPQAGRVSAADMATGAHSPQAKAASVLRPGAGSYLLDQVHVEPKVRPARADAPEAKYRVKQGAAPGVFGLPSTMGEAAGLTPSKQLEQSQKIGVPKIEQPKMQPLSAKVAFAVSQFSGTLGGGTRDIYRTGEFKTAGPPGEKKAKGAVKAAAMRDELMKLNAVATTPKGKLHQTQQVGAPKATPPPGPSVSELSKPVGYGTKAPGAVKGTI